MKESQRASRKDGALTWADVLGAQRDAAAAPSWADADLQTRRCKLLGAEADWNTAEGLELNPIVIGKSRLASRWDIEVRAWDRYRKSGKLPSRRTSAGGLKKKKKKKKKRVEPATMKTELPSGSAERKRFSTRHVLNEGAYKRVANAHSARLAQERANAEILEAQVAALERERAEYQRALTKSERKLAKSARRWEALHSGNTGNLTRKGSAVVTTILEAAEEKQRQHDELVAASFQRTVVRVERQLALANERCRAEKAKREEAERLNAKIEERMKLHLAKQRAATQVAKRALKARSRAEVREGKAHEAVEELHAEREQLMDSLRAQEARVKELETFAALLREHNTLSRGRWRTRSRHAGHRVVVSSGTTSERRRACFV